MFKIKKILLLVVLIIFVSTAFVGCMNKNYDLDEEDKEIVTNKLIKTIVKFKEKKEADRLEDLLGYWNQNVYINELLSLTLTVPDYWYIMPRDELLELLGVTFELMEDSLGTEKYEEYNNLVIPLMAAYDDSDIMQSMSNINIIAGRSLLKPDYEKYFEVTKENITKVFGSYGELKFSDVQPVTVGGMQMLRMKTTLGVDGIIILQSVTYMFFKKGYVLTITTSLFGESSYELDSIINSLTFTR